MTTASGTLQQVKTDTANAYNQRVGKTWSVWNSAKLKTDNGFTKSVHLQPEVEQTDSVWNSVTMI